MTDRSDIARVYKAPDGWRWRVLAANGEVIAQGEAYERRVDATRMLEEHFPNVRVVIDEDDGA